MTVGPQWRDVFDLVAASEQRILAAIHEVKEVATDHGSRIDALENSAERRTGSQTTATLFLGLPGHVIGLFASAAALIVSLAAVWALMGRL